MEQWFAEPTDDVHLPPFLSPLEFRQVIIHKMLLDRDKSSSRSVASRQRGRRCKMTSSLDVSPTRPQTLGQRRNRKENNGRKSLLLRFGNYGRSNGQLETRWFTERIWLHNRTSNAESQRLNCNLLTIPGSSWNLSFNGHCFEACRIISNNTQPRSHETGLIRESLRRAKRCALKGVRSMRSYFAPVR
jgi:hypothetical protein